jgi:FRG domain
MYHATASTVSEFVDHVAQFWDHCKGLDIAQADPAWIWYRGVSKYPDYALRPSFYRNFVNCKSPAQIDDAERILVREFKYKQGLYDTSHVGYVSGLEGPVIFGKMQHYGLGTRLLDFSYSGLVALYASVGDWRAWRNSGHLANLGHDGAVWMVDPSVANSVLVRENFILDLDEKDDYLPMGLRPKSVCLPEPAVAIEAPLSNKRIIAQQGCFFCFGTDQRPLDEQLGNSFEQIGVVVIPKDAKSTIYDQLEQLGVSDDALFQDLETYANCLHRRYHDIS